MPRLLLVNFHRRVTKILVCKCLSPSSNVRYRLAYTSQAHFIKMFDSAAIAIAVSTGDEKYPKFQKQFQYGTAGFREKAEELPHILFRMGLLAALRSATKKAAIGVMVTASHNPVQDNGVKLVDPLGEMLEPAWEKIGTDLANADDLGACLRKIIADFKLDEKNEKPFVFLGRDTRPSSQGLVDAAKAGAEIFGAPLFCTMWWLVETCLVSWDCPLKRAISTEFVMPSKSCVVPN
jgi:hypothetical protein